MAISNVDVNPIMTRAHKLLEHQSKQQAFYFDIDGWLIQWKV